MGDPRKQRKKYRKPSHPWQKTRIEEEKVLVQDYGLKNKKDLWRMTSKLAKFKQQAKSLIAKTDKQAIIEKELFMKKLQKLSLITADATLDDILDLSVKDLLERRLQTLVLRKGYAKTMKQSRQMIVHQHITINDQKFDVPSFLVPSLFEDKIEFLPKSPFSDPEHPERKIEELKVEEEKVKEEGKEEEEKVVEVKK
ncbi:MAG: 30S ribosomal protein S4 [Nanoarchaeota archaeon]|nr:30S ribosomal protein S4 [Nanoarchaeota archaeon]